MSLKIDQKEKLIKTSNPVIMNYMTNTISISMLTVILLLVSNPAQGQEVDFTAVDEYLNQGIENGKLTGIFVGHISSGGEVTKITKGTLKINGSNPVTAQSYFEIGSISKVFTATLLAQVMQEHDLSLDDKAGEYMPNGITLPRFNDQEILIRHLITHTSGLPSLPDNMFPEDASNPYADYTLPELKKYLSGTKLTRAPGSRFAYSNMGLALVGHIVESVTGIEYEQLVIDRIAKPLNMSNTAIKISAADSNRLAKGHAQGKTVSNWDLPVFEGAGALRSTGDDMMLFLKAQMGLIKSDLWTYMKQTQKPLFEIEKGLNSHTDKIGMAWFYATDKDTIVWHSGGTGGYRSFIGINKESGSGAVILSNSTADLSDLYFYLLDSRYELIKGEENISLTTDQLERFVGKYNSNRGFSFYVTNENGQLFVRLTGQSKAPVEPVADNIFVNKQVGAEFAFDTTGEGEVTRLTLRQGGQEIPAEKVSDLVTQTETREAISLEESVLRQYTGTYQLTPNFSIKVTLEAGQLYAQATGQQKFPVYPESKTSFFYKVVEAQLEFKNSGDGGFDKLELHQGGRVLVGSRVKM